jgi:hypothetical protein
MITVERKEEMRNKKLNSGIMEIILAQMGKH